jgi:hypothetical protein
MREVQAINEDKLDILRTYFGASVIDHILRYVHGVDTIENACQLKCDAPCPTSDFQTASAGSLHSVAIVRRSPANWNCHDRRIRHSSTEIHHPAACWGGMQLPKTGRLYPIVSIQCLISVESSNRLHMSKPHVFCRQRTSCSCFTS